MGIDGLDLGLGFLPFFESGKIKAGKGPTVANFGASLTLKLSSYDRNSRAGGGSVRGVGVEGREDGGKLGNYTRESGSPSSFLNGMKREREVGGSEEAGTVDERACLRAMSDEDEDGVSARKKLRLTKTQSSLLEESFRRHTTLNPQQKHELAMELKLRPRQVEVWFQNRRARTKIKKTEVDLEYLKKCCEALTEENRWLRRELQELKSLTPSRPFYVQMPVAAMTVCLKCQRVGGDLLTAVDGPFTMAPRPNLFSPFANPPAAC